MSLPESSPKLPKWFFLLSDALLIAVAVFIAANSARPLSLGAILAIVACVLTGALLTSAALIADYARRQEDGFDDRQHALEALSRTVATSAEQISIATAGLNELTDLAHKNLKHAEQLPHKLQERVNDFTRQLNEAAVTENETLQQEVNALRAAEAEKLETAGDKIAKATTELAKLESATAKHLAATSEALTKLPEALARARNEAEQALTTAQTRALQSLELKFAELVRTLEAKVATLATTARPSEPAPAAVDAPEPKPLPTATEAAPDPVTVEPTPPAPIDPPAPAREPEPTVATPTVDESTPAAAEEPTTSSTGTSTPEEATEPKPARKPRAPKKARLEDPADELALPLTADDPAPSSGSDEFAQLAPEEAAPASAVSTDGATRVLVTAYIGIGNRLFIRGDGPGLSRDKGVPLQFVSIGKWRWETGEATGPIHARLYKNDEIECTVLGELTLEPGHQAEVTATF
jgi:hypothetical protein